MPLEIDIDFEGDLASQVCDIQVKANPEARGARGGPIEGPWTTEQAAVPCLIVPGPTRVEYVANQPVGRRTATIFFGRRIVLGTRRRIIYRDPVEGDRTFHGDPAENVAEVGVIWKVEVTEVQPQAEATPPG